MPCRSYRPLLEVLEDRLTPSLQWKPVGDYNALNAANWTDTQDFSHRVPTSSDDILFDAYNSNCFVLAAQALWCRSIWSTVNYTSTLVLDGSLTVWGGSSAWLNGNIVSYQGTGHLYLTNSTVFDYEAERFDSQNPGGTQTGTLNVLVYNNAQLQFHKTALYIRASLWVGYTTEGDNNNPSPGTVTFDTDLVSMFYVFSNVNVSSDGVLDLNEDMDLLNYSHSYNIPVLLNNYGTVNRNGLVGLTREVDFAMRNYGVFNLNYGCGVSFFGGGASDFTQSGANSRTDLDDNTTLGVDGADTNGGLIVGGGTSGGAVNVLGGWVYAGTHGLVTVNGDMGFFNSSTLSLGVYSALTVVGGLAFANNSTLYVDVNGVDGEQCDTIQALTVDIGSSCELSCSTQGAVDPMSGPHTYNIIQASVSLTGSFGIYNWFGDPASYAWTPIYDYGQGTFSLAD